VTNGVNTRELIVEVLLLVNRDGEYSHIALRKILEKYQYLTKQERAFITRVCEGTLEYRIRIDYIINRFSNVKTEKMKPFIRELLRSGAYQIIYMNGIPDSAVCNEAVKLAQKKGFYSLKGFVNGVLRTIVRDVKSVMLPAKENPIEYLSVSYSMPKWLVEKWLEQFGKETTKTILQSFFTERPTSIRINEYLNSTAETIRSLENQGVRVEKAPYVPTAYYISNYDYLMTLDVFREGLIQVQDVSSMLVGEIASPRKSDTIIDLCAAPGGKSMHVADKMQGYGTVEARDISSRKVKLIEENFKRAGLINASAGRKDATVYDADSVEKADVVLADVPCSGFGVIGKKVDIKYKMTPGKHQELISLQRKILENAAAYTKVGGILIYSTCTFDREENQENIRWFTKNYPFTLETIDPYICEELKCSTTKKGYLQLLPGIHECDGFFIARLKRIR